MHSTILVELKKTVLLTLFLMFLLSALIVTSSAQERELGVNVGDWFKYSGFDVNWSSGVPNATVPSDVEELNEVEWMKATVVSVIGTNVTSQRVVHFRNGTEAAFDSWIDVDTGDGDYVVPFFPISANLDVNDTPWSGEYFSDFRINETVIRTYLDGARETNYINMTWVDDIPWDYVTWIVYWDRPTGVPVEIFYEHEDFGGEHLLWVVRISESNVWIITEFPTWTSMLLILIVFTVAIAIYKRRLLKTPIH